MNTEQIWFFYLFCFNDIFYFLLSNHLHMYHQILGLFPEQVKMTQILAPITQCQLRIAKNPVNASPMAPNTWSSLVLRQKKNENVKWSSKFRVFAMKAENTSINRIEDLLNLDVTPYTNKIIAEYIWYDFVSSQSLSSTHFEWYGLCFSLPLMSSYCEAGLEGQESICGASRG